jgi:FSR family fosmidomycin resistance protein-like MFS transporter
MSNNADSTIQNSLKKDAYVISLVGLAHGISHFFHLILAPLFPWLKEEFALSYAELGLLMSVFFIVSGVGQALSGFVVDKIGARRVLFFGLSCFFAASIVLATAHHYAILLLGSMLAGLGNSVFHPVDFTILNQCVSTKRLSHAFSVHGITGNLGWASAPIFLVGIAHAFDWRTALFAAAFLPLIVIAILFYFRDLLQAPNTEIVETKSVQSDTSNAASQSTFHFMQSRAVWLCFAFFFLVSMSLGGIQSFSPTALIEVYGMSLGMATSGYTAYMLASALGMLWGGFIAARSINHDRTIAIAFSISASLAVVLAMGWVNSLFAIVLMGAIGLGSGIAGPSRDLLIRSAAPKNATGRVYGVVYSGLDIGLVFSPLMFGAMMDAHHPQWVFVTIGLFQFLAIFAATNVGKNTRQ